MKNPLCVCSNGTHYNCSINDLGYLYPGQTLITFLHSTGDIESNSEIIVKTDVSLPYIKPCIVSNVITEYQQMVYKKCSKVSYTIAFPNENFCHLLLKRASDFDIDVNVCLCKKAYLSTWFC